MLIDTNVIVYALTKGSPKKNAAQQFLTEYNSQIFVAHQSINETLRVITHPKSNKPIPLTKALESIDSITSQFRIISPLPITMPFCLSLIRKYNITSNQVFDAYLVATGLSYEIDTIVTDNVKDLGKYSKIEVLNPFN